MKTAVLMLNLGGPGTLDEVEPFLANLFADPEIISFPFCRFFQGPLSRFIARKRAPVVRERYAMIGGGSPILRWTQLQARGLEARLGPDFMAIPCMRYWQPDTAQALQQAQGFGADRLLILPMYPQYSDATTGSSEREVLRQIERLGIRLPVARIRAWADHPGYLDAMAARARTALQSLHSGERDQAFVLFSAHSLPMKIVRKGDPYPAEIQATVDGIRARLQLRNPWALSFQSKVGPIRWLEPSTEHQTMEVARAGHKALVVVPVSFVSDHIETLHELDIDLRQRALAHGIQRFVVAPGLNDGADFLDALADVVRESLARERAA